MFMDSGVVEHPNERACNECGILLVNDEGMTIKGVFLFDMRVWCIDCLRHQGLVDYCMKGQDVRKRNWYKNSFVKLRKIL